MAKNSTKNSRSGLGISQEQSWAFYLHFAGSIDSKLGFESTEVVSTNPKDKKSLNLPICWPYF